MPVSEGSLQINMQYNMKVSSLEQTKLGKLPEHSEPSQGMGSHCPTMKAAGRAETKDTAGTSVGVVVKGVMATSQSLLFPEQGHLG